MLVSEPTLFLLGFAVLCCLSGPSGCQHTADSSVMPSATDACLSALGNCELSSLLTVSFQGVLRAWTPLSVSPCDSVGSVQGSTWAANLQLRQVRVLDSAWSALSAAAASHIAMSLMICCRVCIVTIMHEQTLFVIMHCSRPNVVLRSIANWCWALSHLGLESCVHDLVLCYS